MNMKNFTEFNTELDEAIDKEHPIVKEYDSLKKNHDIKSLRGLIKGQHRIVDTSEFKTKDHAISHYLRTKHGDTKVDKAFGFKEEVVSEAMPGSLSKSDYAPGPRKSLKDTEKTSKFKVATNAVGGHKEHSVEVDATSKNHALNQAAEHFAKKGLKSREHFDGLRIKESAICTHCESDPCICDDSHGFVSEAAQGHTIEAHGIRGMKGTAWRKTFKSHEHLAKWADANDSVEVHAVRDLDGVKKKTNEEALSEGANQHKVNVTVSEKDHPMVSKRSEKQQKRVIVTAADKDEAVSKAKKFYTKQGYHVHDTEYLSVQPKSSLKTEETVMSFNQFIDIIESATWYSKEKFMADAEKKHGKITHTSRDKDGRTHYHIAGGQTSGMSDTDGEGSTSYNVHAKPHTAK